MSGIVTGETDIRNIEIPDYEFIEEEMGVFENAEITEGEDDGK